MEQHSPSSGPGTVAVAGATGGLGSAICRGLAASGWSLLLAYRHNEAGAQALCDDLARGGGTVECCQLDLTEPDSVSSFLARAGELPGGLGAVVNATGPAIPLRPMIDVSAAEFREIMRSDVEGAFNLLTAAGRQFSEAGGGSIVQLLTTAVLRTLENDAMSGIPKTAIAGIVRQLARELGPRGVRINGIAPGVIDAGIVHSSFTVDPVAENVIASCLEHTPASRMGRPDEVAALAGFLLAPEAAYINGQIIGIDGGYSA